MSCLISELVENYGNPNEIRDCYYKGMLDMASAEDNVQALYADYLNELIEIGVAGFRFDSAFYIDSEVISCCRLYFLSLVHIAYT